MDYKEIKQLEQNYRKSKCDLTNGIIAWLEENIKEGDYLEFGDCSFNVLLETDEDVKTTLCEGVGKSRYIIGGIYCREEDGYEMLPEEMDPIDLYNVAFAVNYILEKNKKKFPHIKVGNYVHWNDPAINDFEPEDREAQLNLVWEIQKIDDTLIKDSTVVHITREDGGEAEVYAHELEPVSV